MKTKTNKFIIFVLVSSIFMFNFIFSCKVDMNNFAYERFSGYGEATDISTQSDTETITYTSKETTITQVPNGVPLYRPIASLANSCGATSGAIIIGYYDKFYEELIPNYTSYISSGKYKNNDNIYIPNLMTELYSLMKTNIDDIGVSKTDCLNGLTDYIKTKGRTVSYSSIINSNKINEANYKNALENKNPSILFCNKLMLYFFTTTKNSETLSTRTYTGGHVAVAYGLYTVRYYNGNNNFRTDKYLQIATALSDYNSGYIKLNSTDWLNYAYSVSIN